MTVWWPIMNNLPNHRICFSCALRADITKRNLMLIIIGAYKELGENSREAAYRSKMRERKTFYFPLPMDQGLPASEE